LPTDAIPIIAKTANSGARLLRPCYQFASARAAFSAYLRAIYIRSNDTVLLPSYIGWTSREGSGVFDPIQEVGCRFAFYRMQQDLSVDLGDFVTRLSEVKPRVVLLLHYFGFPDKNAEQLAAMSNRHGALLVEDEAHAMLSDLQGGCCGRYGDVAIYSLHKLFPVPDGGALISNGVDLEITAPRPSGLPAYDFHQISLRRRANAECLIKLLHHCPGVRPLHRSLAPGVVPQTWPVIIEHGSRDNLYFRMNENGFGVVSLYHTLVSAVTATAFPEAHWLSKRILNLPVHQDADSAQLERLIEALKHFTS
jgi:dTDP-4-amino-4,6-dideoxygalactose transaminase